MRKIFKMIKALIADYKGSNQVDKKLKRECYKRVVGHVFSYFWSIISAPFIYPIWYVFRVKITLKLLNSDIWGEELNWFWHWVWTYGDDADPLGRGGMPLDYRNGKNNFINRFWFSAIRNPRFTYNFLHYKTELIKSETTIIDTRNFNSLIKSYGVGDMPEGIIFKWFMSDYRYYFIYEDNSPKSVFWFGWVALLNVSYLKQGRFEIAYRIIKK